LEKTGEPSFQTGPPTSHAWPHCGRNRRTVLWRSSQASVMAHVRGAWKKAHTGVFAYGQRATLLCGPRKQRARQKSEQSAAAGHSAHVTTQC